MEYSGSDWIDQMFLWSTNLFTLFLSNLEYEQCVGHMRRLPTNPVSEVVADLSLGGGVCWLFGKVWVELLLDILVARFCGADG